VFATVFVLLYVAHLLADYVLQTDAQASLKADRTRAGWWANLTHAATHVIVCAVALGVGAFALDGLDLPAGRTVAAVAWVGVTHAFIDRRWPIAWWMDHTGSADFRTRGGAAHVDQAAHVVALAVAALVIAT
jgi:Protein of unknown function (DUF3307)